MSNLYRGPSKDTS